MIIIDANVILRYLLDDVEEMAEEAAEVIENSGVRVLPEVMAEVVYVLEGVYDLERKKIKEILAKFIQLNTVLINKEKAVQEALDKYGASNLDFVDCLLYGYSQNGKQEVFTFDQKLTREIKESNNDGE